MYGPVPAPAGATLNRSPARWTAADVAALVHDGREMAHYVDGQREASGPLAFRPLGPGRTSIGVRQNRVSWFRGRIRAIRFLPEAVVPRAAPGAGGPALAASSRRSRHVLRTAGLSGPAPLVRTSVR